MVEMKKIHIILLLLVMVPLSVVFAQEEVSYEGVVKSFEEVPCSEVFSEGYNCFEYTIDIPELDTEQRTTPLLSETENPKFKGGDRVYITSVTDEFGNQAWSITGYVRGNSMLLLLIIFAVIAILVGRRQGLGSLVSLALTLLILYLWAIPKILNGADIMIIGIMTVLFTLVIIMYVSHGFNMKSTVAVISTIIGILIVGIFAKIFSTLTHVDGSGSEEAFLLLSQTDGTIDLSGVFFISILIGAMGVLDDVVMSQVSAIQELYHANKDLNTLQLYSKAMNIGRDHISSMVNTLFIAYAGSSFALVMLLTYNSGGIGEVLKTDVIAEEVVRTLTSSIGILLIVPISSIIAAKLIPLTSKRVNTD